MIHALDAFGFASPGVDAQDFLEPQAMEQLGYSPARIDLLTTIDGITFDEAFANQVKFDIGELKLPVISVDVLIRNKLEAGRIKHRIRGVKIHRPLSANGPVLVANPTRH
ncbi:MAG: hypothetical protein ABIZ64_08605 [Casimicrobium sp.]